MGHVVIELWDRRKIVLRASGHVQIGRDWKSEYQEKGFRARSVFMPRPTKARFLQLGGGTLLIIWKHDEVEIIPPQSAKSVKRWLTKRYPEITWETLSGLMEDSAKSEVATPRT